MRWIDVFDEVIAPGILLACGVVASYMLFSM